MFRIRTKVSNVERRNVLGRNLGLFGLTKRKRQNRVIHVVCRKMVPLSSISLGGASLRENGEANGSGSAMGCLEKSADVKVIGMEILGMVAGCSS